MSFLQTLFRTGISSPKIYDSASQSELGKEIRIGYIIVMHNMEGKGPETEGRPPATNVRRFLGSWSISSWSLRHPFASMDGH
ncbi:hypothetical protein PG994_008340 [Apiospora phragmitis]|uniref:Uncharacterized protein n=1 Tax=Apiospora phragmitis TaxID=2905665 RepID=A0ABR1USR2_9PEZI